MVTPFANVRADYFYAEDVPRPGSDQNTEDAPRPGSDQNTEDVPLATSNQATDFYAAPTAGLDVRMPFVNTMGSLQGVLTPVAQIIASPSEPDLQNTGNEDAITLNFDTTNLFLSDRFTGYDRWEGGVRANTGVIYTLMGPEGGFLRASIGESFHIAGENSFLVGSGLNGTASDLVGGVALQVNPNITLGYQARVEEDLSRINVQESMIGLNLGQFSGSLNYANISAAANYGRPDNEKQIWADGRYDLLSGWSVFGGVRYNLKTDKVIDQRLGVTFDCDCMKVDVVYSMSRTDAFGPVDGGTEYRIDLNVELRTIGAIAGGFQLP
jgi:LPS-assembly protein